MLLIASDSSALLLLSMQHVSTHTCERPWRAACAAQKRSLEEPGLGGYVLGVVEVEVGVEVGLEVDVEVEVMMSEYVTSSASGPYVCERIAYAGIVAVSGELMKSRNWRGGEVSVLSPSTWMTVTVGNERRRIASFACGWVLSLGATPGDAITG
jgi:hypothetical protein